MNGLLSESERRGGGGTLIQLLSKRWQLWNLTVGDREAADTAQALSAAGADLTAGFHASFPKLLPSLPSRCANISVETLALGHLSPFTKGPQEGKVRSSNMVSWLNGLHLFP